MYEMQKWFYISYTYSSNFSVSQYTFENSLSVGHETVLFNF